MSRLGNLWRSTTGQLGATVSGLLKSTCPGTQVHQCLLRVNHFSLAAVFIFSFLSSLSVLLLFLSVQLLASAPSFAIVAAASSAIFFVSAPIASSFSYCVLSSEGHGAAQATAFRRTQQSFLPYCSCRLTLAARRESPGISWYDCLQHSFSAYLLFLRKRSALPHFRLAHLHALDSFQLHAGKAAAVT